MKAASIALFAGLVACAFVQLTEAADAVTYKEKVLHSFGGGTDGLYPIAGVINVNGILYGTTTAGGGAVQGCGGQGCGTLFAVDRNTGAESVVHSFCSKPGCADGASPYADLIDAKGILYGATLEGGTGLEGGDGTVFAFDPGSSVETVLYSFCQQQNCLDGANPIAALIDVKGTLYGATGDGGSSFFGTAFALDPNTGSEKVLYSFCSQKNCTDGQNPIGVIDVNGTLYGTTAGGGAYLCPSGGGTGCGTVFSLNRKTGAEKVRHSFGNGTDGQAPGSSLIVVNGLLYGTTNWGGNPGCGDYGCGTVFSVDPNTGAETVLYAFCSRQNCTDGANPQAGLIAEQGLLYGTTYAGGGTGCGGYGCGTVFSIDPSTGAETVLYSFCSQPNCADGANPAAAPIAVHGNLYGTTYLGGASGTGTVYVLKKEH